MPELYSDRGILNDRPPPFIVRATATIAPPAGEYRLMVRTRQFTRVIVDGKTLIDTGFPKRSTDGHNPYIPPPKPTEPYMPAPRVGDIEKIAALTTDGEPRTVVLEVMVGGQGRRMEAGEPVVVLATKGGEFHLIGPSPEVPFSATAWPEFLRERQSRHADENIVRRRAAAAKDDDFWRKRHDAAFV